MQIKSESLRYFIELSYNGKNFFGWQIQPKEISVQETIEKSLSTLLRQTISIIGAGRTDTGVHARKLFAHFDFDENLPEDLLHRLNSFLPKDIFISRIFPVKPSAHARFDALERTYHYLVQIGKNPFNYNSAWQIHQDLDIKKMNEAAVFLLGKQDFSSFAKLHTDVKTHICDVKQAVWTKETDWNENEFLKFQITADRFLRNMVRSIVGTLVDVGRNKISIEEFQQIIHQKDRKFASGSAPAQGLYLYNVTYPNSIFENE
ncbi:MAG: tRNA pseudouridine(38-40) synthase TruA [Weeksellaceae bacterium]|nr:tRNA pseudouridine(38-40) synthase TruA [Weeksellaceae bacterium]MDX9704757.1 tRNA pseudouridine(38-40) synthase TruA [Weeksellaceae bacterium]